MNIGDKAPEIPKGDRGVGLFLCQGSLLQLFEGAAQLVGAGGAFAAAADAVDAGDDIVDFLATDQLADALQVAVASAKEEDLLDDVVLVGRYVD